MSVRGLSGALITLRKTSYYEDFVFLSAKEFIAVVS